MAELKLYVWEDVLQSYSPGIAFALASSPEEARRVLIAKAAAQCSPEPLAKDIEKEPLVFDEPVGFYMWGGG